VGADGQLALRARGGGGLADRGLPDGIGLAPDADFGRACPAGTLRSKPGAARRPVLDPWPLDETAILGPRGGGRDRSRAASSVRPLLRSGGTAASGCEQPPAHRTLPARGFSAARGAAPSAAVAVRSTRAGAVADALARAGRATQALVLVLSWPSAFAPSTSDGLSRQRLPRRHHRSALGQRSPLLPTLAGACARRRRGAG